MGLPCRRPATVALFVCNLACPRASALASESCAKGHDQDKSYKGHRDGQSLAAPREHSYPRESTSVDVVVGKQRKKFREIRCVQHLMEQICRQNQAILPRLPLQYFDLLATSLPSEIGSDCAA